MFLRNHFCQSNAKDLIAIASRAEIAHETVHGEAGSAQAHVAPLLLHAAVPRVECEPCHMMRFPGCTRVSAWELGTRNPDAVLSTALGILHATQCGAPQLMCVENMEQLAGTTCTAVSALSNEHSRACAWLDVFRAIQKRRLEARVCSLRRSAFSIVATACRPSATHLVLRRAYDLAIVLPTLNAHGGNRLAPWLSTVPEVNAFFEVGASWILPPETSHAAAVLHQVLSSRLRSWYAQSHRQAHGLLKRILLWPLRQPKAAARLRIDGNKGVIICGAPGNGRSLIIRMLSCEAGLQIINVPLPQLISPTLGFSEMILCRLFAYAHAAAPCLLLLDELQAAFCSRCDYEAGRQAVSAPAHRHQMLSQLLIEISALYDRNYACRTANISGAGQADSEQGFRAAVVVIGVTSTPMTLDPALLSAGRFEYAAFI